MRACEKAARIVTYRDRMKITLTSTPPAYLDMAKKTRIPHKFQPWIEARKKFHLSHAHIQMARELGLSPKKFGSYANRDSQPWKLPLVDFIEFLYERQFHKKSPDEVKTMEQFAAEHTIARAKKKAAKLAAGDISPEEGPSDHAESSD